MGRDTATPPLEHLSSADFLLGSSMGQRLARQDVDEGVRLYHLQKHEEAKEKWRTALKKLKSAEDRFITMGYLAQAYCEAGSYKDMLVYALHQIDLANEQEDSYMKAEAYLNLARANERLCEFHKAISYGKHSLQSQSMDPRTPGYAYLCIGSAYLGFSNFQLALDHLEQAMRVANTTQDKLLELQICVGLGSLFTQLKDLSKAVVFLRNALSLLKSVSIQDVHAKYKSLILYHLSVALRRKGAFQDAKAACEEALRLAAENGNRPVQGRCLHSLGDIHREFRDIEKTWSRYEAGLAQMEELSDKMGLIWVLASMAKSSTQLKRGSDSACECQAIQFNKRCLELSKSIGCKLAMMKCHARLQMIYEHLSDDESEDVAKKAVTALAQELELFCNFCGQRYAVKDESLQALPCSHIFHERCLQTYLSAREKKHCPKCQHRAATLDTLGNPNLSPNLSTQPSSARGGKSARKLYASSNRIPASSSYYDNPGPSTSAAAFTSSVDTPLAGTSLAVSFDSTDPRVLSPANPDQSHSGGGHCVINLDETNPPKPLPSATASARGACSDSELNPSPVMITDFGVMSRTGGGGHGHLWAASEEARGRGAARGRRPGPGGIPMSSSQSLPRSIPTRRPRDSSHSPSRELHSRSYTVTEV